jgi:predicted TIM-barrel fold metal-dependent hydrolase
MRLIDCDAHVVETDHTWAYLDKSELRFRPQLVRPPGEASSEFWLIDGKIRGLARAVITAAKFEQLSREAGRRMDTPQETREMENVEARVHHMDELGVDVQVLYPTVFIQQVTDRAEVEVALCRSYNQWVADLCKNQLERLRWICVLPLLSMPDALEQLEWSRQRGAVGVFMRGVEGQRLLHDPYFYPLYDAVSRANMAIGVHVGNANTQEIDLLAQRNGNGFWRFRLAIVGACHSLIMSEVPAQFPKLRFHFAEAASQWVPYVVKDLQRRWPGRKGGEPFPNDAMARFNMYVSCETDDDLAYVIKYAGESNLVIGTDYGHNDQSTEIDALRNLKDNGGLGADQYRKIVDDNARALWNLSA